MTRTSVQNISSKRIVRILCGLLMIALVMEAVAVESQCPVTESAVPGPKQWIEQLSSPSRQIRHEAEQALRTSGPDVLPEILNALDQVPFGARETLQKIQRELQTAAAKKVLEEADPFQMKITLAPARQSGEIHLSRVNFQIDANPFIDPQFIAVHDGDFQLIAGSQRLLPFSPDARRELDFDGQNAQFSMNFTGDLSVEKSPPQIIGKMKIHCGVLPETLRFPLNEKTHRIQFAGQTRVQLISMERKLDHILVVLRVTFPPGVQWDTHRQAQQHQSAWLESSSGEKISPTGLTVLIDSTSVHEVHYEFPQRQIPVVGLQLVYHTPALQTVVSLPVEQRLSTGKRSDE